MRQSTGQNNQNHRILAEASPASKLPREFWGVTWKKFRAAAVRLIKPGDRVLALVSGGPDSSAMAYWLSMLAQRRRFDLAIAHFDHTLRPEQAPGERRLVEGLAGRLGLPFYFRRLPVAGYAKTRRLSLEDAARRLRYRAAALIARRHGFTRVAAAHTLEEQAESVLINILRGGSLAGLCGCREQRPLSASGRILLVRPMLAVSKREALSFLESRDFIYVRDPMNHNPRFLRSRVRSEILPKLVELHPRALEHLSGLGEKLGVE
ncbi:MAG: tRNA lysidine(34) synthetase TilS [Elusimicrobia bacterium]|nr:tRNA lysidine(34) synthetase TilS [Elusimicrobiota bacterium]